VPIPTGLSYNEPWPVVGAERLEMLGRLHRRLGERTGPFLEQWFPEWLMDYLCVLDRLLDEVDCSSQPKE
jgi:hypothetical protein